MEDLEEQRPLLNDKKSTSKPFKIDISALPIGCTIVLLFLVSFITYEAFPKRLLSFQNFQSAAAISSQSTCLLPDSQSASQPCAGKLVTLHTRATSDGKWPSGLTWSILSKDSGGEHLSRVYEESGTEATPNSMCSYFSRMTCLDPGSYMIFVDSSIRSASVVPYVNICDQGNRVNIGEAYDFDTSNLVGCGSVTANEIFDKTPISDSEEALPDEKPAHKATANTLKLIAGTSNSEINEIFDSTPVSDSEESLPEEKAAERPQKNTPAAVSDKGIGSSEIFDSTPISDSEESLPDEKPVAKPLATKSSTTPDVVSAVNDIYDSTPVSDSEENLPEEAPSSKISNAAMNEIFDTTPVSDSEENLPNEKAAEKATKAVPGILRSAEASVEVAMKLISSAQQLLLGQKR